MWRIIIIHIRVVTFAAHHDHMIKSVPTAIKWVGTNRGHPSRYQSMTSLNAAANAMPFTYSHPLQRDHIQLYNSIGDMAEPVPPIIVVLMT